MTGDGNISVIIPTHQRRERLLRALRSVMAQSEPAAEVIVIDDGSTDGSAAAVAREFPQVRLVEQPQRGVSHARNQGIGLASSPWLAFLDSDDEWLPEKLARQRQAARENPDCPLIHCDEIWIRNGRRVNPKRRHRKRGGRIYQHCLPLCCISPSAAMIRRDCLHALGGFDENLPACEDYDLWLRLCSRYPVAYLDETLLIKHGGHDDQLSRRYPAMDRFRIRALLKILDSGILDRTQQTATVAMLEAKARVYSAGASKRGRLDECRQLAAEIAAVTGR